MTRYVVVEVTDDSFRGMSVRVFGEHADAPSAEAARRRAHLSNTLDLPAWQNRPRTFVARVEDESV